MKFFSPRILVGALVAFVLLLATAVFMWIMPPRDTSPFQKPVPSPNSVSIIAFGDQGTGDYRQRRVAALLEAQCRRLPDLAFIQTLGDNFYFKGVQSTSDPLWHVALQGIYNTPCLEHTPFHAALGNHDEEGDPAVQIAYSKAAPGPIQWYMPATYYTTRVGKAPDGRTLVTLVVIDTNMALEDQIQLIDRTFADPNASVWRLVAGHHNVRTNSVKYHDDDRLRRTLLPTLIRDHVHFYLAGHSHNLQLIEHPGEPVYVIAGGGGKHPRKLLQHPENRTLLARRALGFATLTFTPSQADVQFTETSGEFFTTFSVHKDSFRVDRACLDQTSRAHCVAPAN